MAKITVNSLFSNLYGKIGGLVFRRSRKGKTILSRLPNMSRVKWSKAQKAHRHRFKAAVLFAQAAMQDPVQKAYYEQIALERDSIAFNMAISEYFKVLKAAEE
jgi:hypothetical protein